MVLRKSVASQASGEVRKSAGFGTSKVRDWAEVE